MKAVRFLLLSICQFRHWKKCPVVNVTVGTVWLLRACGAVQWLCAPPGRRACGYCGIMGISTRAPVIAGRAWMDATGGPMNVMWVHVPAASSADDLATVVDRYPPGAEGRYYLLHMALCEGRVDALVDAWEQRGYEVQIAETLLRYTFGPQQAYFAVFWV